MHPNDEQAKEWEGQNGKTEMWYVVEAGTIHAIGKGSVIAEIQQNSNVTYRLYDYGRVGKDGKERELHIEKGVKAANCKKVDAREIPVGFDGTRLLASCEYFEVKEIKVNGEKTLIADEKSYHALIVTEGEVELSCEDYSETLTVGQTVFIPANLGEYLLLGNATVLLTTNSSGDISPKYITETAEGLLLANDSIFKRGYNAGIDVKMTQEILGHNLVNVTLEIYTHLSNENKRLSADRLNEYISSQSNVSQTPKLRLVTKKKNDLKPLISSHF